jgi:RNA polymerase sigma-70 factor, ECF subfamily
MLQNNRDQEQLIALAQSGDRTAFTQLVQQCSQQVYNLAYRLSGNQADAEDLAQEAFLSAYKSIRQFKHDSAFSSWVYRITVNLWKNRVRHEKRRQFFRHFSLDASAQVEAPDTQKDLPDATPGPYEQMESADEQQAAMRALNQLAENERAVLVLGDIEQKSYQEMADLLKCPVGTVRSRLARAREHLRQSFFKNTEAAK